MKEPNETPHLNIHHQSAFEVIDRENSRWWVTALSLECTMGVLEDLPMGDYNIRYVFSRN